MLRLLSKIDRKQAGFTLVELLVVVAILGVLAAVAVPNVGKFVNRGREESYNTELHNLQTGVMAMLADSRSGVLDSSYTNITDMDQVTTDNNSATLSTFMTGLNSDGTVRTGCTYTISQDGGVILQSTP